MFYLILAQSKTTAAALGAWLDLLGEDPLETSDGKQVDKRIIFSRTLDSVPGGFVATFQMVAAALTRELEGLQSGDVVVFVDSVRPSNLNAVGSASGWDRLIFLLILSFPEVRWSFGVSTGEKPTSWEARHGLASLLAPAFDPIFDGLGLRDHILRLTSSSEMISKNEQRQRLAPWIPRRTEWAASLDDEAIYAYFHGYIAYRNGFRAFAIHTQVLADSLLKEQGNMDARDLGNPYLTFEDHYLGFPDKDGNRHFTLLEGRGGWNRLDMAAGRYFITSGHGRNLGGKVVAKANCDYRARLRSEQRGGMEATKPIPGIFALWQEFRLDRSLCHWDVAGNTYRGMAPDFDWPPNEHLFPQDDATTGGHSAPGLLLLVAEYLIERAEVLLESVRTVKDAVRGAVLAATAFELLGPKTPTTARAALELKHRFEALAECQFGGVQYNLQLDDRFAEIRRDMRMLGKWYGKRARAGALINGELTIISRLMAIYEDHGEFDEAEVCRDRVRALHRRVWWRQNCTNPLAWLVLPFRAYIEYLLGSTMRFAFAVIAWLACLSLGFTALKAAAMRYDGSEIQPVAGQAALSDELQTFGQALSSFFGAEPLASSHPAWMVLTVVATVSGFIHLGIFISQIYSTLARK